MHKLFSLVFVLGILCVPSAQAMPVAPLGSPQQFLSAGDMALVFVAVSSAAAHRCTSTVSVIAATAMLITVDLTFASMTTVASLRRTKRLAASARI